MISRDFQAALAGAAANATPVREDSDWEHSDSQAATAAPPAPGTLPALAVAAVAAVPEGTEPMLGQSTRAEMAALDCSSQISRPSAFRDGSEVVEVAEP